MPGNQKSKVFDSEDSIRQAPGLLQVRLTTTETRIRGSGDRLVIEVLRVARLDEEVPAFDEQAEVLGQEGQ